MSRVTTTMPDVSGGRRALYLALAALVALGLWFSASRPAGAHHPKSNGGTFHIESMDSVSNYENACTQSHISNFAQSTMRGRVVTALTGNGTGDWDGTGSNAIDFRVDDTYCQNQTAAEDAATELEYHGYPNGTICGGGNGVSCAVAYDTYYTPGGPGHARYYWAYLNSVDIAGSSEQNWHHIVNHETGHMFGLADPSYGSCLGDDSVMHSQFYGCAYTRYWPTSQDRSSVTALINS